MAGMPQTKLLIAELMLTSVSIISPYLDANLLICKIKREPDRTKIHHVLCPMVSGLRRVQASLLMHAPRKGKTDVKNITKQCCYSTIVKILTPIMHRKKL
jgi:hypothetical protein